MRNVKAPGILNSFPAHIKLLVALGTMLFIKIKQLTGMVNGGISISMPHRTDGNSNLMKRFFPVKLLGDPLFHLLIINQVSPEIRGISYIKFCRENAVNEILSCF